MWIEHTTKNQPVSDNTVIIAVLEDGYQLAPMKASEISWDCPGDDVVKYALVN